MAWRLSSMSVSKNRVPMGAAGVMVPARFVGHFDVEDNRPNVEITWEVVDGIPVCREVRIVAVDTEHEVQCSGMAGVRVEDLLEATVKGLLWNSDLRLPDDDATADVFPSGTDARGRVAVRELRQARRERKVKVTDELLAEVAQVYRANLEQHPTAAVAEHFGKSHRTAARYVALAREADFLGAAVKGKGGEQ